MQIVVTNRLKTLPNTSYYLKAERSAGMYELRASTFYVTNLSFQLQILGVLDFGRDAWIHREDWIKNGIHPGSGRKYKDSYYLQAQVMCYMNN